MNARDWKSFNDAFDGFTGPAQNVIYADLEGHIGWRAHRPHPAARARDDGSVPVDGTTSAHDWRGFVPQAEMPRVSIRRRATWSPQPARHRQLVPPPGGGALGQPGPRPPHRELIEATPRHTRDSIEQISSTSSRSPTASFCGCGCRSSRRPRSPTGCALGRRRPRRRRPDAGRARPAARAARELHTALLGPEAEPFGWYNDDEALQAALARPARLDRAGLGDKALLPRETRAVDWMGAARTWGAFDRTRSTTPSRAARRAALAL